MARVDKGSTLLESVMQPDRSIVEKNDGTLEGSIIFKSTDADNFPEIDDLHPDDDRLECYNKALTYNSNGLITCQASYFGIIRSIYQISYTGGSNSDPIETHKDFTATIGGTAALPKNDASFDEDTEEFLGFPKGDLQGVQYYLTSSNTLTISYWMDSPPNLSSIMSVVNDPQSVGSRVVTNPLELPVLVRNWLMVSIPVRRVGNFFQVTEQWMGSGEDGWNNKIYPKQS